MGRGTKCLVCRADLYYHGTPQFVPEYCVAVGTQQQLGAMAHHYVHIKCWNKLVKKLQTSCSMQTKRP